MGIIELNIPITKASNTPTKKAQAPILLFLNLAILTPPFNN